MPKFATVDEYLATQPPEAASRLRELRELVRRELPEAGERISYDIPTFTLDGRNVVHLAGWQRHISVYPVPAADPELAAELAPYVAGKGTLKFPLAAPLPIPLITRVVRALADRDAGPR